MDYRHLKLYFDKMVNGLQGELDYGGLLKANSDEDENLW